MSNSRGEEAFLKIIKSKIAYEAHAGRPDAQAWNKKHFLDCPWGISWNVSPAGRLKDKDLAITYLLVSVIIGWDALRDQLLRTIKNYKVTKADFEQLVTAWDGHYGEFVDFTKQCINKLSQDDIKKLQEAVIEQHKELNPKLWENNELKPEVQEKLEEVINAFITDLTESNIKLDIKDVVLVGSNANYNYTDDSDLDVHILADMSNTKCPDNLYPILYSAYRTLFKNKLDIKFYGIPVEIFVETEDIPAISGGVYSIKDKQWLTVPEYGSIPEVDSDSIEEAVKPWKARYKKIIKNAVKIFNVDTETDLFEDAVDYTVNTLIDDINAYLDEIYELRKEGLQSDGEYSTGNLVFKAVRNSGDLDKLKRLKQKCVSKLLSLESLQ